MKLLKKIKILGETYTVEYLDYDKKLHAISFKLNLELDEKKVCQLESGILKDNNLFKE